jgi:hypothetical protein
MHLTIPNDKFEILANDAVVQCCIFGEVIYG